VLVVEVVVVERVAAGANTRQTPADMATSVAMFRREKEAGGRPRTNKNMHLIELRDITKTYHLGEIDVPVLKGVSLEVARGELVALMGASGSGKSTMMNILGCLDRPTSGSYRLDGQEIADLSSDERARVRNGKIGFVFQSFNLLARTTALENVMMPLSYAPHISEKEAKRRAKELLDRVGLADRMDHYPSQLSGGQQQRVAIARSLINHPPLLFADEPTGNLDSHTSKEVLEMFQRLNEDEKITIILVTHDPGVGSIAKRTILMRDGKIENEEEARTVREPLHEPAASARPAAVALGGAR